MFTIKKKLLLSLAVIAVGEMTLGNSARAYPDNGIVRVNNSLVSQPGSNNNGSLNTESGNLNAEGIGGSITIPPDILQAISNLEGVNNINQATGRNTVSEGDPISAGIDGVGADSSNTVTICFSDPCVPSGEGTKAITLNELAELIENDLQQSLEAVAAAEALEQEVADKPRKFVRRRATDCISPAVQARETFNRKFQQSQEFLEQIKQLDPNNSVW